MKVDAQASSAGGLFPTGAPPDIVWVTCDQPGIEAGASGG